MLHSIMLLHLQVQPRWLLSDFTIVCWHLYCYPLAAGVLKGIGFLAIWDQKVGIGAPFIGTLPSTYPPVEPRALVEMYIYMRRLE